MPVPLRDPHLRALLLDIEGTTTPVEFVYQVLFPYARRHVKEFIEQHHAALQPDIAQLRKEHSIDVQQNLTPPPWQEESVDSQIESVVTYVHWLMDQDRKATGLKWLQGKIWEAGYRRGELRSEVFTDVAPAFTRWCRQEKQIAIFSSGSVLAQKLLFAHTTAGDLTSFIWGYFDTTPGAKTAVESYQRIARTLARAPSEILFVSDAIPELEAARQAGLATAFCVRLAPSEVAGGEHAEPAHSPHPVIHSFAEIFPEARSV